jgi:transposase
LGKSDPIDAEMAARAVLAGVAKDYPKSGLDKVEMIRMLKIVKDSAIKARTQAINQMKALIVTAPVELRHKLAELNVRRLVARCASFRPGELVAPLATAKHALRLLARRHYQLTSEIEGIDSELVRLTSETAPALVDVFGIGPDTAATLLVTAGSNPERLRSEAAFAALCGVNPIPASSGKTNRHRLNRGGDRQANSALYRIVLVRLRYHKPTMEYMSRRMGEGMTKPEIIRCLKRYVARQIYPVLREMGDKNIALAAS